MLNRSFTINQAPGRMYLSGAWCYQVFIFEVEVHLLGFIFR